MLRSFLTIFLCSFSIAVMAQTSHFADSIRRTYKIPELAYAVVSADSVLELNVAGVRKAGTMLKATPTDRFRVGSNTKAFTGMMAALLVKEGTIAWQTRFFDLFPELKAGSRKEHYDLTLIDLLTFRTKLYRYTYTYPEPDKEQFKGTEAEQRYQFAQWFLAQEPVQTTDSVNFSNLAYVAAGLMLERASGRSYEQLATDLGSKIGMTIGYGRPNAKDSTRICGHDVSLHPEIRSENDHKLSWLQAAGNINCTLPEYARFIQEHLRGLQGRSDLLSRQNYEMILFGRPRFAVGWLPATDITGRRYAYNVGNPGTFLSKVYIFPDENKAFIILTNAQTEACDEGTNVLYEELQKRYLYGGP